MPKIVGQIGSLVNRRDINTAFWVLKCFSNPLQAEITQLLDENHTMTVNNIARGVMRPQCVVSNYLAQMRDTGVVNSQRDGKHIHYSLNYERIQKIIEISDALSKEAIVSSEDTQ